MPAAPSGVDPGPTEFPELNRVLEHLVGRVDDALGQNLVGVYLQGSFAVGDADMQSDCDFLVVTARELTQRQESALRELHDELPTRPGHWTAHLEGSYPPAGDLRTLDGLGRPWLYIDHGWRRMQWSTHCNSEVVRWTLRERGRTLVGPAPSSLVEPVSGNVLRARMRRDVESFLEDLFTWINFDIAWAQRYAVATLCRILYTVHFGEVASKRSSMRWAIDRLDAAWQPLIRQSDADRVLGWDPNCPPRPGSVERTLAFIEYAKRLTRGSTDMGIDPHALR